ncbi:MAG TPA: capsular biosynthesis protein CpsI [Candidatus Atribacteria bacterium]|nr:capsular biosynthesis protein CpsI [Candidatus Atribacteria bacterium]
MSKNKKLVTGAAGFIGFHLCKRLLKEGDEVVGIDNLNDYYDVALKKDRLAQLKSKKNFKFIKLSLEKKEEVLLLLSSKAFDVVVNLAAQAGVRYSLINPYAYLDSNIYGFLNILEGCRHAKVKHLVFASSSSVYGLNTRMPFSVHQNVDHPISLYGATKKANELMAHSYSYLFGIPTTGLRFFTVYGPWGRPDMALFLFTRAILENRPIDIYNFGNMERDFTYIDDIIESVIRVMKKIPDPNPQWSSENPDPATSAAPFKLYNIGNNNPVKLLNLIKVLEECLGKKAKKNFLPIQPGDVPATFADVENLIKDVDFKPTTPIEEGVKNFVRWYQKYFRA